MREPEDTRKYDVAEVLESSKPVSKQALLVQVAGDQPGRAFCLSTPLYVLGRDESCSIQIEADGVSRRHCEVVLSKKGYSIVDLDSTNGISVNGEPCKDHPLQEGDRIALGPHAVLVYHLYQLDEGEALSHVYDSVGKDIGTGALNREHFIEWTQSELDLARAQQFELAFFAVSIGQSEDDDVTLNVKAVATRLFDCLDNLKKAGGTVARLGSLDFVLAQPYSRDPEVQETWRQLYLHLGEVGGSYSVGLATSREVPMATPEKLLRESLRKLRLAQMGIPNSMVR